MGLIDDVFSLFFPPKQYGTPSVTVRGEEVKSHGEQKIADLLECNGIRYEYEPLIETGIWIFTEKVSRPDFYLPDYDVYVEYWGMVDAEDEYDRATYVRSMKWKMRQYHELGIKFISLYPRNLRNLDWIFRKKFREVTGRDFPRQDGRRRQVNRGGPGHEPSRTDGPLVGNEPTREQRAPSTGTEKRNPPVDVVFECDHCGQSLVVEVAGAGLTLDCPTCGKPVLVPSRSVIGGSGLSR